MSATVGRKVRAVACFAHILSMVKRGGVRFAW